MIRRHGLSSIPSGQSGLLKFPAGGGAPVTVAQSGLDATAGVAVDGAGDIYVSGTIGSTPYLYEFVPRGSSQLLNIPANYMAVDGAEPAVEASGGGPKPG